MKLRWWTFCSSHFHVRKSGIYKYFCSCRFSFKIWDFPWDSYLKLARPIWVFEGTPKLWKPKNITKWRNVPVLFQPKASQNNFSEIQIFNIFVGVSYALSVKKFLKDFVNVGCKKSWKSEFLTNCSGTL